MFKKQNKKGKNKMIFDIIIPIYFILITTICIYVIIDNSRRFSALLKEEELNGRLITELDSRIDEEKVLRRIIRLNNDRIKDLTENNDLIKKELGRKNFDEEQLLTIIKSNNETIKDLYMRNKELVNIRDNDSSMEILPDENSTQESLFKNVKH